MQDREPADRGSTPPTGPKGSTKAVIAAAVAVLVVLAAAAGFLVGHTRGAASGPSSTTHGAPTTGTRDLSVEGAPNDGLDYAIQNPSCTVNSSDTMVIATGTFAGTSGSPVPTLAPDRTYNVNIGVFDAHGNVLGTSASNEGTDYIDNGGRWSVQVKLFSGFAPTFCMYSIGTYGLGPPAGTAPQVPPALN